MDVPLGNRAMRFDFRWTSKRHRQHGLTRADLLVIVGLLVLLGTIFAPLLLSKRADSRLTVCERNVALATQALLRSVERRQRLPPINSGPLATDRLSVLGRVAPGAPPTPPAPENENAASATWQHDGYSWLCQILPELGENAAYDQLSRQSNQFQLPAFSPAMLQPAATGDVPLISRTIRGLTCPDAVDSRTAADPQQFGVTRGQTVAGTSYVAMAAATRGVNQPGIVDEGDPKLAPPWGDLLPIASTNIVTRIATNPATNTKSDGTANRPAAESARAIELPDETRDDAASARARQAPAPVLIVETRQARLSSWYSGQASWVTAFPPDIAPSMTQTDAGLLTLEADHGKLPATALNRGAKWQTQAPPASADYYSTSLAGGIRDWGPSSEHRGGLVVHGFADGRVQSIPDTIDPIVYLRMVSDR